MPFYVRRLGLLRSAGVRFAAIYAVLLSLSVGALALFLWWETAGLLNRQTDAAINADAQSLAEHWEVGGLRALAQTIEDRLSQNVDDDAIYLLTDPSMRPIAGNLDELAEDRHRDRRASTRCRSSAPACARSRNCSASTCRAAFTCWSAATYRCARGSRRC